MNKSNIFRKYWLGILGVILIASVLLILYYTPKSVDQNIKDFGKNIEVVTLLLGWVLFFVQYLYSKSEKVYIVINNLRLWLTNETVTWNFTIDYQNWSHSKPLDEIKNTINQSYDKAKYWCHDEDNLIVNMSGYSLRAILAEHRNSMDFENSVSIQVSNLQLPFRSFRSRIENEIIPLVNEISKKIEPETEKYSAKISFLSPNPYFGFFVRKLALPNVITFTCDLLEDSVGGEDRNVTIHKDRIVIVTNDLFALQALSIKYVALSNQ